MPVSAWAQDEETDATAEGSLARQGQGQVYEPGYFAQFSPRTALDMIEQIPGFQLSGGGGGNNARGLGQASDNVLVNGERLSSKSDSARDQLKRIPANDVLRIEIVDGTSLDVPGLSGQVANVVVDLQGISGSFSWKARVRTTEVDPEWYGGEISVAGTTGDLTFTVALQNENSRSGAQGPTLITDASGTLLQAEDTVSVTAFDKPTLTANLGYDFGNSVNGTLNLRYARSYFRRKEDEAINGPLLPSNLRAIRTIEDGYEYEISGDLTFPLGAGTLKLIGVERYDSEDFGQSVVATFDDATLIPVGDRFTRLDGIGERIGRLEYSFPLAGADWQLAGEAAFNRLDRVSGLFELDGSGAFAELDFPDGTGGVTEDRYDISASVSTPITDWLSFQATAGYEFSKIRQTGSAANDRSFARPKGSASLAWTNGGGLDVTLTMQRSVGQLSFGDFLARVFLDNDNANAGNNELVPSQTWEAQIEINKSLGEWGSTTFMYDQRWIEDYVDVIPFAGGGEGNGNIPAARRTEMEWTTTLKLEPIGWNGAQLNIRLEYEEGELRDPLTGQLRDFSRGRDREAEIDLRHDIPGTDFAYGGRLRYERDRPYFRLEEIGREQSGPSFISAFIEHKDLLGTNARLTVGNLIGGRATFTRTVYDGPRTTAPVLFFEDQDRRIGPIIRLDVSGNF